jgi:hypothetical protein
MATERSEMEGQKKETVALLASAKAQATAAAALKGKLDRKLAALNEVE